MGSYETSNYEQLVKALRHLSTGRCEDSRPCEVCAIFETCLTRCVLDAAAAIEALDRLLDQNTQRCEALRKQLREAHESYERHLNDLDAEVKRLKLSCADCEYGNSEWPEDPEHTKMPKRGEWVGVNPMVDSVQCSICGGQLFSAELETPYCPYCGAKMEVQDGENES